jgi:hypothetical protein
MIDWSIFKQNVDLYLKNFVAQSERDFAKYITSQYEIAILNGTEQYQNTPISYNKIVLEESILMALNMAQTTGKSDNIATVISSGLIQFWTGAMMGLTIPPIGSISVVSNIVLNPGSVGTMTIINSNDTNNFITQLITLFRIHLTTITGITTALVPQPTGTPIPIPYPWVGIQ